MLFTIPKEKFFSAAITAKKVSIGLAVAGTVGLLLSRDLCGLSEKLSMGAVMLAREDLIKNGEPGLNDVDYYVFKPFFCTLVKKR